MRRDESDDASVLLERVAAFWSISLPDAFSALYRSFGSAFLPPCEYFGLDAIVSGAGREYGMLPQYLPFGRAVGEGGLYGFYVTPENATSRLPVLYWDEDERYLRPVASDFDAFLRYCALAGRYESEAQTVEDSAEWASEIDLHRLSHEAGIPGELLFAPVPRSESELHERLVASDPQNAVSLSILGCSARDRGEFERALDLFHRSMEAAPWFGDPGYLLADTHLRRKCPERAVQGWWSVVQKQLSLCTRTWEWDLGPHHEEADIYEVAADGLAQFAGYADASLKSHALWRVVVHDDPYDPDVRESLGDALLSQNRPLEAEREFLNALSLCALERGRQPERLYDFLLGLYERLGRRRDADLLRFDRALPRSFE